MSTLSLEWKLPFRSSLVHIYKTRSLRGVRNTIVFDTNNIKQVWKINYFFVYHLVYLLNFIFESHWRLKGESRKIINDVTYIVSTTLKFHVGKQLFVVKGDIKKEKIVTEGWFFFFLKLFETPT